jgi:hypothetical protein
MHDLANPRGSLHGKTRIVSWIAQLAAAVILGQTLFFKFSGAPESVQIFEQLGAEPWGRIGSGVMELVAVVLLLTPRLAALGGLLASGLMVGAIGSHLTRLGIEVAGDGGTLFAMAWVVLISGTAVAYLRRGQLPISGRRDAESRIDTVEAL